MLSINGVQVTDIDRNHFVDSAQVKIEHTVGEPQSRILKNNFSDTPKTHIVELHVSGEHTATVLENVYR